MKTETMELADNHRLDIKGRRDEQICLIYGDAREVFAEIDLWPDQAEELARLLVAAAAAADPEGASVRASASRDALKLRVGEAVREACSTTIAETHTPGEGITAHEAIDECGAAVDALDLAAIVAGVE